MCSERCREAGEGYGGRGGGLDEAMESVLNADGDGGADTWDGITNGCAVGGVVGGGAEREHSVPGDGAVDDEQGLVRGGENFKGQASGKVFTRIVRGGGVTNVRREEGCNGEVGDHRMV